MKLLHRTITLIVLATLFVLPAQLSAQPDMSTVLSVDWNKTGTKIAVGHDTGNQHTGIVEVIDSSTGQTLHRYQFPGYIAEVAWSPHDSDLLAAVANYIDMPGTIHILNTATGQEIMTLTEGEQIVSITWKPDGSHIAASIGYTTSPGISRYITIWDTATWQVSSNIVIGPVEPSLDWSPDDNLIASGEDDGIITVWDVNTGAVANSLTGHTWAVFAVAWSPDGNLLASASSIVDPTIRIWDAATGQALLVIPDSGADKIAWSPDGTLIAAADIVETVHIWDATSGELVDTIVSDYGVYDVAWSPDGRMLVLGTDSGRIEMVAAPTGHDPANSSCGRAIRGR